MPNSQSRFSAKPATCCCKGWSENKIPRDPLQNYSIKQAGIDNHYHEFLYSMAILEVQLYGMPVCSIFQALCAATSNRFNRAAMF
jgi:hypothetical protein